jgi:response regulator RpfG family c-di-GMP phosphodiesterase
MHSHPEIGYRIMSHIGYFTKAAEIIRNHHEHFDGTGYPRGLKGADIPLGARVFAVADALDALTVKRPYREALPFEEAQRAIVAASGKNFDPAVLEAFVQTTDKLKSCIGIIAI